MTFINERGNGVARTIDYERNAILRSIRGGGDANVRFVDFQLLWHDAKIEFTAIPKDSNYLGPIPQCVEWTIYSCIIPEYLEARRSDVINLIKEALLCYGNLGAPDWKGSSTVIVGPNVRLES